MQGVCLHLDIAGEWSAVHAATFVKDVGLYRAVRQGSEIACCVRNEPKCSASARLSGDPRWAFRQQNSPWNRSWSRRRCVVIRASGGKGDSGEEDGSKDMQELLVEMLRLQTGQARVDEFVEDKSKYLTEIADQAKEEFKRLAEEARRNMDEARSKVLDQIDADAAGFEEELAAARAEMEASELDLEQFEKSVEKARSEGLFFKNLFAKPTKPWKAKSPEEQQEIKEKAEVVTQDLYQTTRKAAASKFRRAAYGVMIVLLSLTVLESVSSQEVQWPKLILYVLLLLGLVVQLTYETLFTRDRKE